jgi:aryl-alcohol dehydrogenase-like predicted oxidoreductase
VQPGIGVPLASARSPAQLDELLAVAELTLNDAEVALLDEVSRE